MVSSLYETAAYFCGFNNKKQALCENQYGMENESASVQSDSKIWKVQCLVGTLSLSISNYDCNYDYRLRWWLRG